MGLHRHGPAHLFGPSLASSCESCPHFRLVRTAFRSAVPQCLQHCAATHCVRQPAPPGRQRRAEPPPIKPRDIGPLSPTRPRYRADASDDSESLGARRGGDRRARGGSAGNRFVAAGARRGRRKRGMPPARPGQPCPAGGGRMRRCGSAQPRDLAGRGPRRLGIVHAPRREAYMRQAEKLACAKQRSLNAPSRETDMRQGENLACPKKRNCACEFPSTWHTILEEGNDLE